MNKKNICDEFKIFEVLKRFGGFVRYYDSTEPLERLFSIVSEHRPCRDVLACCAGGDQVLTMLGANSQISSLYAVDVNASQLFILAAKAYFLKQHSILPAFEDLKKVYPGMIAAVKEDRRSLKQMPLYHIHTKKKIMPPKVLAEKYYVVVNDSMFVLPKSGPFWQKDPEFIKRVRAKVSRIRLTHTDIFNCPERFKQGSLDLIYLSDIYWQEELEYYQSKLTGLVNLLRLKGKIVTYLDPGDDFMGKGISPSRMILKQAKKMDLAIRQDKDSRYLVFERVRRV